MPCSPDSRARWRRPLPFPRARSRTTRRNRVKSHSVDDRSDQPCACVARALDSARPRGREVPPGRSSRFRAGWQNFLHLFVVTSDAYTSRVVLASESLLARGREFASHVFSCVSLEWCFTREETKNRFGGFRLVSLVSIVSIVGRLTRPRWRARRTRTARSSPPRAQRL